MAKNESAVKDLADLGAASNEAESKKREPKLDKEGRSYGTGRRKESTARVWLKRGKGKITVNGKPQEQYFGRQTHLLVLNQPFLIAGRVGEFDIVCTVAGGGLSGQAGAIRHGISRALDNFEPALHTPLKKAGFLTRDARQVERKKVGRHKARRSKQWAKR
jgi:small subunit ribosomal protein S9